MNATDPFSIDFNQQPHASDKPVLNKIVDKLKQVLKRNHVTFLHAYGVMNFLNENDKEFAEKQLVQIRVHAADAITRKPTKENKTNGGG